MSLDGCGIVQSDTFGLRVLFDRVGGYGVEEGFEILEVGNLESFFHCSVNGY